MLWILPLLATPVVSALLCLPLARGAWGRRVSLAGASLTLVLALALAWRVLTGGEFTAAGGWLHADALAALLAGVIAVVALASTAYGNDYMAHEDEGHHAASWASGRYDALFHGLVAALLTATLSNNLGLLWIAIEASTLTSALLVGYYRRPGAVEAGWKYLILCSVGITLALLGTVLLYASAVPALGQGATGMQWTALRDHASRLEPRFVKLAFLFALVGYGTKAGLAPMHTWLPDAHSQSPTPVSALLSAALLATALTALIRFHAIAARCLGPHYSEGLLIGFGLLSMAVAVPFMLIQGDYKRLLAYSSVEHTGLITLAIGLGTPLALFGGLFHLVNHALAKTLAFLVGGSIGHAAGSRRMDHWSGVVESSPALGGLLVVAGVALAGLPPAGMFLSEWLVIAGGLAAGRIAVVVGMLAALGVVFVGLSFHWTRMALGKPSRALADPLPRRSRVPLWILAAAILLLGVYLPSPLRRLLEQAALVIRS